MIVQYTGDAPPNFDGVVLIDCWHPRESEYKKQIFFHRLCEFLRNIKGDCTQIINASAKLKLDYDDPSIINTLKRYCWDQSTDIKNITTNQYNTQIAINTLNQFSGSYTTFLGLKTILDWHTSFYITTMEDFLIHWHLQGVAKSTDWLVAGQSWQNCVHNNSVGLKAFSKLIEHYHLNFYVQEEFVLTEDDTNPTENDFSNDTLNWLKYHGTGIYKLMPST
jgi:hypothetical protein